MIEGVGSQSSHINCKVVYKQQLRDAYGKVTEYPSSLLSLLCYVWAAGVASLTFPDREPVRIDGVQFWKIVKQVNRCS